MIVTVKLSFPILVVCRYFCEQLAGFGAELGMTFPPPTEYKSLKDRMKMEQMFRYYQTQDIELVVCFIGNKGDPIYRKF